MSDQNNTAAKVFGLNKQRISQGVKNIKKSVTEIFQRLKATTFRRKYSGISYENETQFVIASESKFDIDMMTKFSKSSKTTLDSMHIIESGSIYTIDANHGKQTRSPPSASPNLKPKSKSQSETEKSIGIPKVAFSIQTQHSLGETIDNGIYEDISSKAGDNRSKASDKKLFVSVASMTDKEPHFAKPTIAARLKQKQKRGSRSNKLIANRNNSRKTNPNSMKMQSIMVSTDDDIIIGPFNSLDAKFFDQSQITTDLKSNQNSQDSRETELKKVGKNKITQFPEVRIRKKFNDVEDEFDDTNSILEMDLELEDLNDFVSSRTMGSQTIGQDFDLLHGTRRIKPKKYIFPRHTHYLPHFSTALPSNERISIGQYMKKKYKY